jgi:hypothetical protein
MDWLKPFIHVEDSTGWQIGQNKPVEFLKEALALLPEKHALRVVRADAGFLTSNYWVFSSSVGCLTSSWHG